MMSQRIAKPLTRTTGQRSGPQSSSQAPVRLLALSLLALSTLASGCAERPPVERPPVERPTVKRSPVERSPVETSPANPRLDNPRLENPPVENPPLENPPVESSPDASPLPDDAWVDARARMVETQIAARGVKNERVLAAMRRAPRHEFVPTNLQRLAYADHALPIGLEQTISQPYIVAFMSEALALEGDEKVLEIGTGSGYQAAVLAELAGAVYTIEIVPELAARARAALDHTGYDRVNTRTGDGYRGWPEEAPFDAIILTAAPDHVPQPLLDQLAVGGRLILPLGGDWQELVLLTKTAAGGVTRRTLLPVRFVPMTGEAEGER